MIIIHHLTGGLTGNRVLLPCANHLVGCEFPHQVARARPQCYDCRFAAQQRPPRTKHIAPDTRDSCIASFQPVLLLEVLIGFQNVDFSRFLESSICGSAVTIALLASCNAIHSRRFFQVLRQQIVSGRN